MRVLMLMCGLMAAGSSQSICAQVVNNWANWRGPNYDGSLEGVDPPIHWSATENIRWKVAVPGEGKSTPIIWGDHIYLTAAIKTEKQGVPADNSSQAAPSGRRPPGAGGPPPGPRERGGAGGPPGDRPRGGGPLGGPGGGPGRGPGGGGPPGGGPPGGGGAMNNPQPTHVYQFVVLAYDRHDGSEAWRTVVHEAVPHESGHPTNSYASASPVTDGQSLVVSFGSQGVYCLDLGGKLLWSRDLGRMMTRNAFGEGGSPALHGNVLVVPWDHEGDSALFALDAKTGETLWQTHRDEPTTWATPLIVDLPGGAQVVTNGTTVRSYSLKDGKLLWECGGQVTNPIPCPVRVGDQVICMTGYRGNAIYCMALDAQGDIRDSDKVLWHREDAAPYVSSPTLYRGRLYFTKSRDGIMSSVDAGTGEVVIPQQRMSGIRDIYASPVAAAERIYFTSREGTTLVVKHSDIYEELSVNALGEPVDASPAISGDEIFIRGSEHLYCIAKQK